MIASEVALDLVEASLRVPSCRLSHQELLLHCSSCFCAAHSWQQSLVRCVAWASAPCRCASTCRKSSCLRRWASKSRSTDSCCRVLLLPPAMLQWLPYADAWHSPGLASVVHSVREPTLASEHASSWLQCRLLWLFLLHCAAL